MVFIKKTIKNAPWVVIAVVLHVIAIATLSIMYVQTHKATDDAPPATIGVAKQSKPEDADPEATPDPIVDRTAIPKPRNEDAELVSLDRDLGLTAEVVTGEEDLTKEVGDPSADPDAAPSSPTGGSSLGVGASGGHAGTGKPSAWAGRSKAGTGLASGRAGGPTVATEEAVRNGLIWLVRHQQTDGSWCAEKLKGVCDAKAGCVPGDHADSFSAQYNEGLSGLSLLAFLGAGFDHTSKVKVVDIVRAKRTRLGEVVTNGLKWLRARQAAHKDGRFSDDGHIYNESLATLAMCEAYGMTGQIQWKEPAQRGLDFLVKAQRLNPNGTGLWGWRYEPREWLEGPEGKAAYPDEKEWKAKQHEADISATAWVVMALKSGELAGLTVPHESMLGAMEFVKHVTVDKGRVAYMDPLQVGRKIAGEGDNYAFHAATLGALGMCVRTFVEKNIDDPVLDLSAKAMLTDLPVVTKDTLSVDYYYWYYGTLALNQLDGPDSPKRSGKYWNAWNRALTDALLPLQDDTKTCARGGWPTPDRWSHGGGPIYRVAINVLTLEVYYRYENAFGASALKKRDPKEAVKEPIDEKK